VLTLSRQGETAEWSIEFLDPECTGRYQNELLGLSYLIDAVRCHAGRGWKPNLVMTTAARGAPKAALEQIFGANVSTGHAVPTIRFDARLLDGAGGPAAKADADRRMLPDEPPLPAYQDELATIVAVTALALCETYPRIDWVAAKLAMTRRSLQRRLAEHGTTFGQLVEDELKRRSLALLVRTSQSVTAIALQLGYADGAHFTRAFKRWSGMTPSAYRQCRG
jgi:AraC-like DNA-binding protein